MSTPTVNADPIVYDQFDHMTRAELQNYLSERNHISSSSATKDALRYLCRYVATRARLRHRQDAARGALATLLGRTFNYSRNEAIAIIEETIDDAANVASALDQANLQIKALRQRLGQVPS